MGPLNEQAARAAALGLLRSLGIPVAPRRADESWGWDGKTIATIRFDASLLVHDGAHWLICPPSRRKFPDFGIGIGPDSGKHAPREIGFHGTDSEEEMASLLGIAYEVTLSFDFAETLRSHSWLQNDGASRVKRVRDIFKKLAKRGLLPDPELRAARDKIIEALREQP